MSVEEWGIVMGVTTSALLGLTPWMFMVHAKLAVLATKLASLESKVDKLISDNERRGPMCALHEVRLDTHAIQLEHLIERLDEVP
jgi:hypothetical protein